MKSSDAKASKCHLKFSSKMTIFIKLVYLSSLISLKYFVLTLKNKYNVLIVLMLYCKTLLLLLRVRLGKVVDGSAV